MPPDIKQDAEKILLDKLEEIDKARLYAADQFDVVASSYRHLTGALRHLADLEGEVLRAKGDALRGPGEVGRGIDSRLATAEQTIDVAVERLAEALSLAGVDHAGARFCGEGLLALVDLAIRHIQVMRRPSAVTVPLSAIKVHDALRAAGLVVPLSEAAFIAGELNRGGA